MLDPHTRIINTHENTVDSPNPVLKGSENFDHDSVIRFGVNRLFGIGSGRGKIYR